MRRIKFILPLFALVLLGVQCPLSKQQAENATEKDLDAAYTGKVIEFLVSPEQMTLEHLVGENNCPQPFESMISLSGPKDGKWELKSKPDWIDFPQQPTSGSFMAYQLLLEPKFNCNVENYDDKEGNVVFEGFSPEGDSLGEEGVQINVSLLQPNF